VTEFASTDNRRLTMRLVAHRTLSIWTDLAGDLEMDLLEILVFTGVWTANTEHLNKVSDRYARLHDLPPDMQRRPIPPAALANRLRLPHALCQSTVERLIERKLVESVASGLIVPAAVFTKPVMMQALTSCLAQASELGDILLALNTTDAAA
jgi:hypothetical protein